MKVRDMVVGMRMNAWIITAIMLFMITQDFECSIALIQHKKGKDRNYCQKNHYK